MREATGRGGIDRPTHRLVMRYHPEVGHLYVPRLVARIPHPRGGYLIRSNASGFRSNSEFEPSRTDKPRVVILGDSLTDGYECDNHERYSDVLADRLGVSIYNYAIAGSAPDQQLLIYEQLARAVDADLILWGVAVHNVERIKLTHRPSTDPLTGSLVLVAKPYFTLENGQLVLHHVPVPRARPSVSAEQTGAFVDEPGHPLQTSRPGLLRAYNAVRGVLDRQLPNAKHYLRSALYRAARVQLNEDYRDADSPGWQLLAALVRRLATSARGTPVLVVPLPTYHYYVDKVKPAYDPLFASLANRGAGLHVLNITKQLADQRSLSERRKCFEVGGHYTPLGHTAVAELLASEITRLGFVRPAVTISAPTPPRREPGRSALGVSFDRGASAAVLVRDGHAIAGGIEAWFNRQANHGGFPELASNFCLEQAGIQQTDLAAVVRARDTASLIARQATLAARDSGGQEWVELVQTWSIDEVRTDVALRQHLNYGGPSLEVTHALAQCASALHSGPFERAVVISLHDSADGTVAAVALGDRRSLSVIKELPGVHGVADLGRAAARALGLPGDRPYVELANLASDEPPLPIADLSRVVTVLDDGGFSIKSLDPTALAESLGVNRNGADQAKHVRQAAASIIEVVREIAVKIADGLTAVPSETPLCLVGDAFLAPAVAAAVTSRTRFHKAWVHSLSGHASAALGSALLAWQHVCRPEAVAGPPTQEAFGPDFSEDEILSFLDTYGLPSRDLGVTNDLLKTLLRGGGLVGLFGPAPPLSGPTTESRCILATSATVGLWDRLRAHDADEASGEVAVAATTDIAAELRKAVQDADQKLVSVPLRLAGEPLALTPVDAFRCLMEGSLDALVLGRRVVLKSEQPEWVNRQPRARNQGTWARADKTQWASQRVRRRAPGAVSPGDATTGPSWQPGTPADEACIVIDRAPEQAVPDRLVAHVPAGPIRSTVAALLSDVFLAVGED